jgi:hypothetical protein
MAQPVKLSAELVLDARLTGDLTQRSIAGQVEFWARLGRAVEKLLRTDQALALKRLGDAQPLSAALESVGTLEARERLATYLASRPFPHFEPAPGRPGLLVKIDADGTRTLGRFVQRTFTPAEPR